MQERKTFDKCPRPRTHVVFLNFGSKLPSKSCKTKSQNGNSATAARFAAVRCGIHHSGAMLFKKLGKVVHGSEIVERPPPRNPEGVKLKSLVV